MREDETKEILKRSKTIVVVGLSREPNKDSYRVGKYLKEHGYRIIPVNPFATEILGEKSYESLLDIPVKIQKILDVVDVFRPAEEVPTIVKQAIKLRKAHGKPSVVWMQLGILNEEAADTAERAGLTVVMDKCMMAEHQRVV